MVHEDRQLIRDIKNAHPRVRDGHGDCANSALAVNRLKAGPENIPEIIYNMATDGSKYSDPWDKWQALYYLGYPDEYKENLWGGNLFHNTWTYNRWKDVAGYENAALFTNDAV